MINVKSLIATLLLEDQLWTDNFFCHSQNLTDCIELWTQVVVWETGCLSLKYNGVLQLASKLVNHIDSNVGLAFIYRNLKFHDCFFRAGPIVRRGRLPWTDIIDCLCKISPILDEPEVQVQLSPFVPEPIEPLCSGANWASLFPVAIYSTNICRRRYLRSKYLNLQCQETLFMRQLQDSFGFPRLSKRSLTFSDNTIPQRTLNLRIFSYLPSAVSMFHIRTYTHIFPIYKSLTNENQRVYHKLNEDQIVSQHIKILFIIQSIS